MTSALEPCVISASLNIIINTDICISCGHFFYSPEILVGLRRVGRQVLISKEAATPLDL